MLEHISQTLFGFEIAFHANVALLLSVQLLFSPSYPIPSLCIRSCVLSCCFDSFFLPRSALLSALSVSLLSESVRQRTFLLAMTNFFRLLSIVTILSLARLRNKDDCLFLPLHLQISRSFAFFFFSPVLSRSCLSSFFLTSISHTSHILMTQFEYSEQSQTLKQAGIPSTYLALCLSPSAPILSSLSSYFIFHLIFAVTSLLSTHVCILRVLPPLLSHSSIFPLSLLSSPSVDKHPIQCSN